MKCYSTATQLASLLLLETMSYVVVGCGSTRAELREIQGIIESWEMTTAGEMANLTRSRSSKLARFKKLLSSHHVD